MRLLAYGAATRHMGVLERCVRAAPVVAAALVLPNNAQTNAIAQTTIGDQRVVEFASEPLASAWRDACRVLGARPAVEKLCRPFLSFFFSSFLFFSIPNS